MDPPDGPTVKSFLDAERDRNIDEESSDEPRLVPQCKDAFVFGEPLVEPSALASFSAFGLGASSSASAVTVSTVESLPALVCF